MPNVRPSHVGPYLAQASTMPKFIWNEYCIISKNRARIVYQNGIGGGRRLFVLVSFSYSESVCKPNLT